MTLDTRAEPGRKDGTIEVEFDLPFPAKVQLHVHSYIRGDIVVQPGAVQFGSVNQGRRRPAASSRSLMPSAATTGRSSGSNAPIRTSKPTLSKPAGRSTQIAYNLSVKLKADSPPGYIQEPLMLVTNDFDAEQGPRAGEHRGVGRRGADGSARRR